jgi:hypothetical protein
MDDRRYRKTQALFTELKIVLKDYIITNKLRISQENRVLRRIFGSKSERERERGSVTKIWKCVNRILHDV